jgi:uncharacterized protein (DUF2147 family)
VKYACLSALAVVLSLAPRVADAASVMGDWLSPAGDAKAHIASCGASLCGTIFWLKQPNDPATGRPHVDALNPDPALRTRPIIGLRFLSGLHPSGENRWAGGRVYDPKSGKTYDSRLSLDARGDLKLEGCVGPFCETRMWTPAT